MEQTFDLSGGRLCLDFANTQHDRHRPDGTEDLREFSDLVRFGEQSTVLSTTGKRTLLTAARREPAHAQAAFRRAIALREAAYRAFSALAAGAEPPLEDLSAIHATAAAAHARARLVKADGAYEPRIDPAEAGFDAVTWAVALSAERLLTERDRPPIRVCSGEHCTWLFLDHSRNRSRRWCSMQDCGNRAKVKRFYQRRRARIAKRT